MSRGDFAQHESDRINFNLESERINMAKQNPQLRDHWNRVKEEHKATEGRGMVEAIRRGGRIQVVAPYRVGFPSDAREIRGKWRPRSRCWSFPGGTTEEKTNLSNLLLKYHEAEMVPNILTLPTLRSGVRSHEPKPYICEGAIHVCAPAVANGNTCQCGRVTINRNGGGWEIRIEDE